MGRTHDWAHQVDHDHLDSVRERRDELAPGGLLHLALEVLAYAVDEARDGTTSTVTVTLHADGSVEVADDGRGTETRLAPDGTPTVKPVMGTRDLRFHDAEQPPLLPDGHARRGASVVSALSTWLVHENRRAEGGWSQRYEHGVPDGPPSVLGATDRTGTSVRFLPDPALVDTTLDTDALARGCAAHAPVVPVTLVDERP